MEGAERLYRAALAAAPRDVTGLYNYAGFLHEARARTHTRTRTRARTHARKQASTNARSQVRGRMHTSARAYIYTHKHTHTQTHTHANTHKPTRTHTQTPACCVPHPHCTCADVCAPLRLKKRCQFFLVIQTNRERVCGFSCPHMLAVAPLRHKVTRRLTRNSAQLRIQLHTAGLC